jgi:DNA-binding NarL/FixJ family response regulator
MRVAIADDSALFRQGLAALLGSAGVEVISEADNGDDLCRDMLADPADVVVMDIRMPPTFTNEGLQAARELRREKPEIGILILSTYAETAYALEVVDIGEHAMGYLLKDRVTDAETLLDSLNRIRQGETVIDPTIVTRLLSRQRTTQKLDRLSERERDVLELMAEGRSNAGIAAELFLHTKTIEHHIATIFSKLGLEESAPHNRRVLAVLTWLRSDG